MNRRGVIAILASIVSTMVPRRVAAQEAVIDVDRNLTLQGLLTTTLISPSQRFYLGLADEGDSGVSSITVEYKGRRVVLTAADIMDALEGKG